MAVRTSVAAVRLIIDTALSDAQVTQHIADASIWVDRRLADACDGQTAGQLEYIERYLAAHLIQKADSTTQDLASATRSDISESYKGGADPNMHSRYAMLAAAQDECGLVAEAWLGKVKARYRVGTTYKDDAT